MNKVTPVISSGLSSNPSSRKVCCRLLCLKKPLFKEGLCCISLLGSVENFAVNFAPIPVLTEVSEHRAILLSVMSLVDHLYLGVSAIFSYCPS